MHTVYKKHIIATFLMLGLSVCAFGALVHFGLSMNEKQQRVAEAKERLISYEQNKKIFEAEAVSLKSIAERTTALEQKRITVDSVPELLSSLESMAHSSNITFAITTVSTPNAGTPTQSLLIDFSGKGSYENIQGFLQTLLSQPYEIQFTKLSLFADAMDTETPPAVPVVAQVSDPKKAQSATPAVEVKKVQQWELLASIKVVSF